MSETVFKVLMFLLVALIVAGMTFLMKTGFRFIGREFGTGALIVVGGVICVGGFIWQFTSSCKNAAKRSRQMKSQETDAEKK